MLNRYLTKSRLKIGGECPTKLFYLDDSAIFSDLELQEMDSLITDGGIANGDAAMTAYSRMQFTEMTDSECERVVKALLKYCELDTFAMVMIWEYWKCEIETHRKKDAA